MHREINISHNNKQLNGTISLQGSKSESNRALIINALSKSPFQIKNLSLSSDTKILQKALSSVDVKININDSGTAMRFLTAYYVITKQNKILTGDKRMQERPIKPLVDALISLGAKIKYLNNEGFPPIKIHESKSEIIGGKISIRAEISSQFITALLMIAPLLQNGIEIKLNGKISSESYINMTLEMMKHFDITSEFNNDIIFIEKQDYKPTEFTVESDWSSAAFWYSMVALSQDAAIFFKGLKQISYQGDAIIKDRYKNFGVITEFSDTGAFITKSSVDEFDIPEIIDFSSHPDLAQTMIVLCAAKGFPCKFTGLENLRLKETDRILALQNELKKFDVSFIEVSQGLFELQGKFNTEESISVETYNDHRMAMAFAPLALVCKEIKIINPDCVKKSYPDFWNHLEVAGFVLD